MSRRTGTGVDRRPTHRIQTRPVPSHVQVVVDGEVIADSCDALEMREGDDAAVYYLPRSDVKMERLERTAHSTHCPFKGDASYFSIRGSVRGENAVWSYEQPFDEVAAIRGRVAFYADRVDSIRLVEQ